MIVVLEGPDNAGKSTLAKYLSEQTGLPIYHSGGPSKYPGEVNERADRYIKDPTPRIMDRHPVISQNAYASIVEGKNQEMVTLERVTAFYETRPLIIYCRPMRPFVPNPSLYAPPEYEDKVAANYDALVRYYDDWAKVHANYIFRLGDDYSPIVAIIKASLPKVRRPDFDMVGDIEEFHTKFDQTYTGLPRLLPSDLAEFREKFITEELDEYLRHTAFATNGTTQGLFARFDRENYVTHLAETLDALVDLTYVVLGAAYLHGFDFRRAWQRVHRANMAKVKAGPNGEGSKRGSKHDIIKPKGWQAPDHTDLVRLHEPVE